MGLFKIKEQVHLCDLCQFIYEIGLVVVGRDTQAIVVIVSGADQLTKSVSIYCSALC